MRAQFPSISTARCNSLACSLGSRKEFCEGYKMRVSLLRTDDWPVVCRLCQCIVMRSFLNLRRSDHRFCQHARLAIAASKGTLSISRFAWYPGHPVWHLFYVGKWAVSALMVLHGASVSKLKNMLDSFLPLVLLNALQLPMAASVLVKSFLFATACQNMSQLEEPILLGNLALAQWIIKRHIRSHWRRFDADVLGIASRRAV